MSDNTQWKTNAIRFARLLQMLFKNAAVFTAAHPTVQTAMATTFDSLNALLKESGQFTIGFVNDRVLLNNILTTDKALSGLETEFLKRGIGALSFDPGITVAAYKRAITVVLGSPNLSESEDPNALANYLSANPVDFVRIHAAPKGQKRTDTGDTILEMDSESFLMSKALEDIRTPGLERLDAFLKGMGVPAAGGLPGFGGGEDAGVVNPGGGGGTSRGGGTQGTGIAGHGTANGSAIGPGTAAAGGPSAITATVESYLNSSLADGEAGPQKSYVELARLIQETRPELVLASFSPQRREELRKLPPSQMAEEVIEDTAVKWAVERLAASPTGNDGRIVEQEVIRVLIRTLQTTQTAARLADKLAHYIEEFKVPTATYARIREELEWAIVPVNDKTTRLLAMGRFHEAQFQRLTLHIHELLKLGKTNQAGSLGEHFFRTITEPESPEFEDLGRIQEFVSACSNLRAETWRFGAERLLTKLRQTLDPMRHLQVVNGLRAIAQVLGRYEAFDAINDIGGALENEIASSRDHELCCKPVLADLLGEHVLDRVIEIYMEKREDQTFARIAPALLRRAGGTGIAKLFQELENQQSASGRMNLLRLISRLGEPAVQYATERLHDERWYVVRNACKLLTDLRDPEILEHLAPLLNHPDERVQKAALSGVIESRLPGRNLVLAQSLAHLHGVLLENATTELMFLRSVDCIPALMGVFGLGRPSAELAAVQFLSMLSDPSADAALLGVVANGAADLASRRAALKSLLRQTGEKHRQELKDFAELHSADPISPEVRAAVAALSTTL